MIKLNVTHQQAHSGCPDRRLWVAYLVLNGRAVRLATADHLDDLRHYAKREGYDGILLGPPSVSQWATLKDIAIKYV